VGTPRGDDIAGHAAAADLGEAVRAGVEEVRYRNGLTVAWLRIGLRLLTLALWVASAARGAGDAYWEAAAVNTVHLAVGAVVLVMHGMEFANGNEVARQCAQGGAACSVG